MKCAIILGFIASIPTISAVLSGNGHVQRVRYPQRWTDAIDICSTDITASTLDVFTSYGEIPVNAAAKCFALCVYRESGVFTDGEFDPTAIEMFLREHIGCHYLLERTITMFKAAANAGNAEPGTPSDKTWVYHITFGTPEHQRLWNAIFRPIKDSWRN